MAAAYLSNSCVRGYHFYQSAEERENLVWSTEMVTRVCEQEMRNLRDICSGLTRSRTYQSALAA